MSSAPKICAQSIGDTSSFVQQDEYKTAAQNNSSRRRKLVLGFLFAGLLLYVVLDFSLQLCSRQEGRIHRLERIDCENRTLSDEEGGYDETDIVWNEAGEICSLGLESPWEAVGYHCVKRCACVNLALNGFLQWLRHHPYWGLWTTALLYTILTLLFIPGSLLAIGSGAAFVMAEGVLLGTVLGTLSVWLGAMTGAILAFAAGRFFFHTTVQAYTSKMLWLKAADRSFHHHGVKLMILLRLSPIIPFNLFNYVMGCTSCSMRKFIIGSAIGIVPGALGYVFVGAALSAAVVTSEQMVENAIYHCAHTGMADDGSATVRLAISIVGGIATVAGVAGIAFLSKREIRKILQEVDESDSNSSRKLSGTSQESSVALDAGGDGSFPINQERIHRVETSMCAVPADTSDEVLSIQET